MSFSTAAALAGAALLLLLVAAVAGTPSNAHFYRRLVFLVSPVYLLVCVLLGSCVM